MEKLILESKVLNDEYTQYVYDNYDITLKENVTNEIPLINLEEVFSFEWNIGLIVGESGSGKSTLLKLFGNDKEIVYDNTKPIVSQFPHLTPQQTAELLHGVGLNSIPLWLQTPNTCSIGQKARLDAAYKLAYAKDGELILFDEWTSVLDRLTSKSLSFSVQRYARQHNLKIIFASCHYDIIEDEDKNHFLQPDWIFNLNLRDENNNCELERLIYSDDKEYNAYKTINPKDVLSERKEVK